MKKDIGLLILACLFLGVGIFFAADAAETTTPHLFLAQFSNAGAGFFITLSLLFYMVGIALFISKIEVD